MSIISFAKGHAKYLLAPLLYRNVPIGLQPRRFYAWLDCLQKTQGLDGAIVEVGVASGGTAVFSRKFLRQGNDPRRYYCVDTFSGFVKEQFEEDVRLGNSWSHFHQFSANSMRLVRRVLDMHGAQDVTLIRGDISKLSPEQLPEFVSACLLDVDLAVPIYDGLKLIWPRLVPGGFIAVDDCYENNVGDWQALKGLQKFCTEASLTPSFFFGMGILEKRKTAA